MILRLLTVSLPFALHRRGIRLSDAAAGTADAGVRRAVRQLPWRDHDRRQRAGDSGLRPVSHGQGSDGDPAGAAAPIADASGRAAEERACGHSRAGGHQSRHGDGRLYRIARVHRRRRRRGRDTPADAGAGRRRPRQHTAADRRTRYQGAGPVRSGGEEPPDQNVRRLSQHRGGDGRARERRRMAADRARDGLARCAGHGNRNSAGQPLSRRALR